MDDEESNVLNEIFLKAAMNPEFRKELFNNPTNVLSKYNLSDDTKQSVLNVLKPQDF